MTGPLLVAFLRENSLMESATILAEELKVHLQSRVLER